ncbi:Glutathione synthetase [Phaffia rhodozyma]|uniref:Glutathione synthetase n=1 Tax=Phaffia rhodozyma TaxID=264483 RepID=A0A0F7SG89_PHARH|nr:Glutathione synthetase [Phaffia rhodozyma]
MAHPALASAIPAWPPSLSQPELDHLASLALDYALSHGLIYRPPYPDPSVHNPLSASAISAPVSLFPSPFPRDLYTRVINLQSAYNELYARITMDDRWLDHVVRGCFWGDNGGDSFMRDVWQGWKDSQEEGVKQPLQLLLSRSDYLLHQSLSKKNEPLSMKQVEFNTISSSFGSLSEKVGGLHRYLTLQTGYLNASPCLQIKNLPANSPIHGLANGLAEAHKAFNIPESSILFVVQDGERNAFDQRWLEYELLETHGIRSHRASLATLQRASSTNSSYQLIYCNPSSPQNTPELISVVYYRAAYTPDDYASPTDWTTRTRIERTTAIKCPSYALQLAGSKKVQQVLTMPGVLEYFLPSSGDLVDSDKEVTPSARKQGAKTYDSIELNALRDSFMGLWPLGDDTTLSEEGERLIKESGGGIGYVLKPQREGGGNNVYNADIGPFLEKLAEQDKKLPASSPPSKSAYILMSLITPPPTLSNLLLRSVPPQTDKPTADYSLALKETISELGVYGATLFGKETGTVHNDGNVGTLLRTKGRESDEGGVAVGYSVLDSVVLI